MQSSNSGSQRLSRAALSRSHFLRLAAGALFPFVGWRLPAAAAPNPELAQNSGGPGTKQAAGPGRTGATLVSQFGPVKIHSYLSPAEGLQVNTQMIEGPNAVVIFDGQLLLPYADEVASYVQTLGKPIDRIILSHAHSDHWGGLQVLTERFADARAFALDGIADQIRAIGPARLAGVRRTYGDGAATKVTVPTETITEGPQRIDGVTYDFRRFVDAESDLQLAALLPEQKVLMAFDLVFSPNQHAFTGAKHFDHWFLESLKALQGYDTVIIGHDTPVDRFAIESTMAYFKRAKEIHAASADAETYSENLKAAFPNLQLARFGDLSASYLIWGLRCQEQKRSHKHLFLALFVAPIRTSAEIILLFGPCGAHPSVPTRGFSGPSRAGAVKDGRCSSGSARTTFLGHSLSAPSKTASSVASGDDLKH